RVYRDGSALPVHQQVISLAEREARNLAVDLPAGAESEFARFRFALDEDELAADDTVYAVWQSAGDRVVLLDAPPVGSVGDFAGGAIAATAELKPALHVG